MCEVIENQTLEIEHMICFRGKVTNAELNEIGRDMEEAVKEAGAKRLGFPITATYGMEQGKVDVELLVPVDKAVGDIKKYHYKKRLKIVNAVMAKHFGNPGYLQKTCNELNQYIEDKGYVPITVGYSIPRQIDMLNLENSEINVYVGVSPNIL